MLRIQGFRPKRTQDSQEDHTWRFTGVVSGAYICFEYGLL